MTRIARTDDQEADTRYRRQLLGTPDSFRLPRSWNKKPDPATRSLTVWETKTSLAPPCAAIRAPIETVMQAAAVADAGVIGHKELPVLRVEPTIRFWVGTRMNPEDSRDTRHQRNWIRTS